jgi:3-(3-hydroxy-phenyl)propionate hydroxylase
VVGAGPVGMVGSLLLARRGIPVLLLERRVSPTDEPRAVHLDDETLRVLQGLGVLPALQPHLTTMHRYELRDARGDLLLAIPRGGRPLGHPRSVLFHQPDLERILLAEIDREPLVDLRRGQAVTAVDPSAPSVTVRAGGATGEVRARAVVACDGAGSAVRRSLGSPLGGRGFSQRWLVADLRVPDRPAALAHPQQRTGPPRPVTSVPIGPERHRVELMAMPGEGDAALEAHLPGVLRRLGIGAAEVERTAVYRFHALHVERWRVGGVLLAGDAAHQMPPFLGQGLCSGIRDAANLAWKLAGALRGVGGQRLLDTYEAERGPQVEETIRRTALLGAVLTAGHPSAPLLRRGTAAALRRTPPLAEVIEGLGPPPLPRGPLVVRRRPLGAGGRPLPQPVVRGRPLDDLLGDGFALVGWETDPLGAAGHASRRFWEGLGTRTIRLGSAEAGSDMGRWFARTGGDVAVVRPDRVVLGVGRSAEPSSIDRLAGRIARLV